MKVVPKLGNALGAPVMQVIGSDGSIEAAPGYEDLTDLTGNENFSNLIDSFLAQRQEKKDAWDLIDEISESVEE